MRTRLRSATHWFAILPLLFAATVSSADGGWDQERVTRLAVELASALKSIATDPALESVKSSPVARRERLIAIISLQRAERIAAVLALKLKNGRTREQTRPFFGEIQQQRRGIGWYTRSSGIPEPIQKWAKAVEKLLKQIAVYYSKR